MKKITLSFLFALATISFAYSQNIQIILPGGKHILNDSVIETFGSASDSGIDSPSFDVINSTNGSLTIEVTRKIIHAVPGSENEICFAGFCNSASVNTSASEVIGAHDTAQLGNVFYGDYEPHNYVGTTIIHYIFFDVNNPSDTSGITIKYEATPAGIAGIRNGAINFSAPYPNPSNSFATFSYNFTNGAQSATLKIFNLIGECVQTLPLSSLQNKASINVQDMPSGIYICEVQANGYQPVCQKLVVSH